MDKVLFFISSNADVFLGILGIFVSLAVMIIQGIKGNLKMVLLSGGAGIMCLVLILCRMISIYRNIEYVTVPEVENKSFQDAKMLLSAMHLDWEPTYQEDENSATDCYVIKQYVKQGEKVLVGTKVGLLLKSYERHLEDIPTSDVSENQGANPAHVPEGDRPSPLPTVGGETLLSLKIGNYSIKGSYYYTGNLNDGTEKQYIISFGKCLTGYFSYSRELTEEEKKNWSHGGKLFDKNGQEVIINGKHASFWSNADGLFAVGFPEDMPAGTYTYQLYQFVNDQYISDSITFNYEK